MLGFGALGSFALGSVPDEGPIAYTKAVVAAVSAGASVTKVVAKSFSAALSVAAAVLYPANRPVALAAAAVGAAGSVLKGVGKPLATAVSGGGALTRAIGKPVAATVAASVVLVRAVGLVTFEISVSAGASVVKGIAKPLSAAIGVVASLLFEAQNITSLLKLHLPVDYFMENLPQYRRRGRTYEPGRGEAGEKTTLSAGPRGRISGKAPGFTTRTGKRGYD